MSIVITLLWSVPHRTREDAMRFNRAKRRGLAFTAVAAAAIMTTGLGVAVAQQASASEGCDVDYKVVGSWGSGFQAAVSITAAEAIDGWELGWEFPGDTTVSQAWNVEWSQSGADFSGTDVGWNGSIPAGETRQVFGFIGSGSTEAPERFTLNGVVCGDQGGEPTDTPSETETPKPPEGKPSALHVEGNRLVDAEGETVVLNGFNRTGTEWPCVDGWGFIDGPSDDAAIEAIASWRPNAVRVPMNELCWLGINGVDPEWTGENYRAFIEDWVDRLTDAGIYVILDLHWSGYGDELVRGQQLMANADHSPDFWTSVAERFKDNPAVLYDLFNEPHDISDACWRDGCTTSEGWEAAGMQDLLDAVRSTGAAQPVIVTCNGWGNGCGGYLDFMPTDPEGKIVAGVHVYEGTGCNTQACWDRDIAPIAAELPTVFSEFGDGGCDHDWSDGMIAWADARGIGWTAWSWYPDCDMPGLIADWDGTPTGYGEGIKEALANRP
ncbi:cellulase family glycosylhydrolase [Glycomyces sp. NEAU-7082]|uniref:Endoglucanase n=1 Tax=Glycomyces albidus TaxID=2656774 RepID=A0A6L5G516_9ACTN|nr:cellulase family glycosylhydrolase [Glycomyces albidus]